MALSGSASRPTRPRKATPVSGPPPLRSLNDRPYPPSRGGLRVPRPSVT